jgi:hypothetical protein
VLTEVAQRITKRLRSVASSVLPGFSSSALSNTRADTFVPETIRHSEATIIRLLRFLTIIATGSCGQAQSPRPFGR